MTPQQYQEKAKPFEKASSPQLKILGGIMIALGALIVLASVAIAATGFGVPPLGIAASAGLLIGFGATFFAKENKSGQVELGKDMHELARELAKDMHGLARLTQ